MAVAADVLAVAAPGEEPPESVRAEGVPPRTVRVPQPAPASPPASSASASAPPAPNAADSRFAAEVARVVREDLAALREGDGGTVAVIAPGGRIAELAAAIPEAVPGNSPEALDAPVALLTVAQAKGLEFDRVVLADPGGILSHSANGGRDLYVAITRATHRLTFVHEGDLPGMLARLA